MLLGPINHRKLRVDWFKKFYEKYEDQRGMQKHTYTYNHILNSKINYSVKVVNSNFLLIQLQTLFEQKKTSVTSADLMMVRLTYFYYI